MNFNYRIGTVLKFVVIVIEEVHRKINFTIGRKTGTVVYVSWDPTSVRSVSTIIYRRIDLINLDQSRRRKRIIMITNYLVAQRS